MNMNVKCTEIDKRKTKVLWEKSCPSAAFSTKNLTTWGVKLLDTDLDRSYFTRHGQHLNSSGKELISNKLSTVIKDLFVKKQLPPICMPWKEKSHLTVLKQNNLDELLENTDASKRLQNNDGVSNSKFSDQKNSKELPNPLNPPKWQRKQVASRSTDFLWT
jgi:hypothetical protein